jgi:8-oxo-dGTP diphosphatase
VTARGGARVAVDVAVCTVRDDALQVLLVQTAGGPFAGAWALPGGLVGDDESLDDAAARELLARTGVAGIYLEQLYTFGRPDRDPAARVVSVAYVALIPHGGRFSGTLDDPALDDPKYRRVAWWPVDRLPPLAYDHADVVRVTVTRLRAKLQYTNLVYTLLPSSFTVSELQAVYEAILGRRLDRRNFRKKILSTGLLAPLGRQRRGAHRPATLYRFRRRRPMTVAIL